MNKILKYKHLIKCLLLVIIFTLLSISIVKNLVGIYAVSSTQHTVCVPILMYHQVKNNQFGKDVISPYEFESDLKFLFESNYNTITMTQLIDYVYEGIELPQNPIILSFDDGYLSTYKYVFPLLKEYNMKIVLSVVGKGTDDFTKVHDENINYSHLSWDQVSEMQESGLVEIQNHSYNLHKICNGRYGCSKKDNESITDYVKLIEEDVNTLQEKVRMATNKTPNTFTYPYGKYSDNLEDIMRKLGFKATLSCRYGVNLINRDEPEKLFGLKRICRAHNHNIKKLLRDGMETLKYADE